MPFWSGESLLRDGPMLFQPFAQDQIDCNAYVLRMGDQYYRTSDRERTEPPKRTNLSPNEAFVIPPGQFAFLLSKETISVPRNAMAFISMRTTIKFRGLINVSGFHVDPGYTGKLVYAVYNASPSPIQLAEGERVFKIWFCYIDQTSELPYIKQPHEGYYDISGEMVHGMNKEILSLQSLAEKMATQESKMQEVLNKVETRFAEQKPVLDNLTFVWRAIVLGVVAAIVVLLLGIGFDSWNRFVSGESAQGRDSPLPKTEAPSNHPPAADTTP